MKVRSGAGTCGATLHWCWTWRVAESFSCLESLAMFSVGISVAFSVCRMEARTLDAEGQVVMLWSAFPHIAHRLFSRRRLTSSGLSFPLGPKNRSCGRGVCRLFCLPRLEGCCDVWDDGVVCQKPKVRGMFGTGLDSFLCVNLCSSIHSQYKMS